MVAIAAPRMNTAHGVRAFAVGLFADVAGTTANPDHAIAIALISVVGGFVVMLVQIVVKNWLTTRRKPQQFPEEEQAELNQLLIAELHRVNAENDRLKRKGQQ